MSEQKEQKLRDYFVLPKYVAYIDESGHSRDPRRNYLCLAGLLAKSAAWKQFDAGWKTACADEGVTEPFHMRDFAGFRRQFKDWTEERRRALLSRLISAIGDARVIPVGSVVSVEDFNSMDARLRAGLRDPYFMAFQPLTYNLAVAVSMEYPPGRVTMVYAHHPEHSEGPANARDLWQALRRFNPIVSTVMESYESDTPRNCTPLQAADLWAYELGHHFNKIRPSGMPPRWPFQRFVEMGLSYSFTHDFITYRDARGVHGLGLMSRVQRWHEVSLYKPGFVARVPSRFI